MNENANLVFDLVVLSSMVFFVARTVYLRSKRDQLVKKYNNTLRQKEVESIISTKRLIIGVGLMLFLIVKTVYDVRSIIQLQGDAAIDQIMIALKTSIFLGIVFVLTIYFLYRKSDLMIKP